ncbi:MAG: hypothetical protein ABL985_19895 [Casimicrobium sp.]
MPNKTDKPTAPRPRTRRVRWPVVVALLVVAGACGSWWVSGMGNDNAASAANERRNAALNASVDASAAANGVALTPRQPGVVAVGGSKADALEIAASADPKAQLALWSQRLARAEEVLDNYRKQTIYPFESRPAREHADQMYPNRFVNEERRLTNPGQKPSAGVRIRTSQERIYVVGSETVLFTVSALDWEGNVLPLTVTRAVAEDPPLDGKPSKRNSVTLGFNDDGANGDVAAGDGIVGVRLSPETQGFSGHAGTIRVSVNLKVGEETGFAFFDIFFTPNPPAVWATSNIAREVVEAGSLNFYLKAQVREAGRYVVTGRIDDAKGQPFALISFNDEVAAGPREFKLNLFGKLLVDEKPAFPLTLRDVDAFLLKPDVDPDRALMPRLPGKVLLSKSYPLSAFSEAEWNSEERERYLAEYGRDVESARAHLEHIRKTMAP